MQITHAVEDIGRQMGMEIRLNHAGLCTLNVGKHGSLFLERREDRLAISLARKITGDAAKALERGLGLCHPKNSPMTSFRVGLFRDNTVVVLCCLAPHHIRAGMHEQVLPYLFEQMAKIV